MMYMWTSDNVCQNCDLRIGFGVDRRSHDSSTPVETLLSGVQITEGDKNVRVIGYILVH